MRTFKRIKIFIKPEQENWSQDAYLIAVRKLSHANTFVHNSSPIISTPFSKCFCVSPVFKNICNNLLRINIQSALILLSFLAKAEVQEDILQDIQPSSMRLGLSYQIDLNLRDEKAILAKYEKKSYGVRLKLSPNLFQGGKQLYEVQEDLKTAPPAKDEIVIEADNLSFHNERLIIGQGNVKIRKEGQLVETDKMKFNQEDQTVTSEGKIVITTQDMKIEGKRSALNVADNVGVIEQANYHLIHENFSSQIKSSLTNPLTQGKRNERLLNQSEKERIFWEQSLDETTLTLANNEGQASAIDSRRKLIARGQADNIYLKGETHKQLENASYTTCAANNDDWFIHAKKIDINTDIQSIQAEHVKVTFKDVPVLYAPWLSFPYIGQRKSGFLAPTWGTTSKSGFDFSLPYYWNIGPNRDATLGLRWLGKRGVQMQGEFRYLEENYDSKANIEYLPNDQQNDKDRYYTKLIHHYNWDNGLKLGINYERVSDNNYFSDFSSQITSTSRVNLPQQISLAYTGENWNFNSIVQQYQTLTPSISNPYQRLPQLNLNGNYDWGGVIANIKNQYTYFDLGSTASLTRPIGSRFISYPSLSFPMHNSYGFITPKIGIHYTQYGLDSRLGQDVDENTSRILPTFNLDSGLLFERKTGIFGQNYQQTLEPRIVYTYIPYQDQSRIPIFDSGILNIQPSTLVLENQYSGGDRINNANQMNLIATTRFIEEGTGVQRLSLSMGQRFYFDNQKVGLPGEVLRKENSSDLIFGGVAKINNNWNIDTLWLFNTNEDQTRRFNFTTRYMPSAGNVLNFTYRFTRDYLEQFNVSGQWAITSKIYGLGRWNYSLSGDKLIEGLLGVEYNAGCWQARTVLQRISTATANTNHALFFQLELGGMASIGSNPTTLLNRSIPGYTSSSLINDEVLH